MAVLDCRWRRRIPVGPFRCRGVLERRRPAMSYSCPWVPSGWSAQWECRLPAKVSPLLIEGMRRFTTTGARRCRWSTGGTGVRMLPQRGHQGRLCMRSQILERLDAEARQPPGGGWPQPEQRGGWQRMKEVGLEAGLDGKEGCYVHMREPNRSVWRLLPSFSGRRPPPMPPACHPPRDTILGRDDTRMPLVECLRASVAILGSCPLLGS